MWFKEAWDRAGLEGHGDDWARTFADWVKGVLDRLGQGIGNAFSEFVHFETDRVWQGEPGLCLPAVA